MNQRELNALRHKRPKVKEIRIKTTNWENAKSGGGILKVRHERAGKVTKERWANS